MSLISQLNAELETRCEHNAQAIISKGAWLFILSSLDPNSPAYDPDNEEWWESIAAFYMEGITHGMNVEREKRHSLTKKIVDGFREQANLLKLWEELYGYE